MIFLEILQGIAHEKLSEVQIKFKNQASVCKYIAPQGYPEKGQKGVDIDLSKVSEGIHFFGAVDLQGDSLISTGSRAVAFVALAPTIEKAGRDTQKAIEQVPGEFIYRSDIGTPALINKRIEQMNALMGSDLKLI